MWGLHAAGTKGRALGHAEDVWVDEVLGKSGNEGSLEANKAACEASVKQSIRELAAWVEQEEQAK
jgi:hypothetical protein